MWGIGAALLLAGCEQADLSRYSLLSESDPASALRSPSPSPRPGGESGFKGRAMLGPMCGAVPVDAPPDYCLAPYQGSFEVRKCRLLQLGEGGVGMQKPPYCDIVASFESDAAGEFKVVIGAGIYFITLTSDVAGRFGTNSMEPQSVEVLPGRVTEIELRIDSGIVPPGAPDVPL